MLALACIVLAAGCSKRNEALCCETTAECTTVGFSSVQPCDLGVCVNYACTTTPGACDDDGDCSSTPSTPTCVANTCSACATSATCPAAAPVCDASSHACRTCAADSECNSGACDLAMGSCIPEDNALYTTPLPLGPTSCTKTSPCSLTHAATLVDANHGYIILSPGVHLGNVIFDGKEATLVGNNATIACSGNVYISVNNGSKLHLRNLTLTDRDSTTVEPPGAIQCGSCSESLVTLDHIIVDLTYRYIFNDVDVTVLHSTISALKFNARHASVDSSSFIASDINFGASTISNSLFASTRLIINTNSDNDSVSRSVANTFYNGQFQFNDGGVNNVLDAQNNIFYNMTSMPAANTSFRYNLAVPALASDGNISGDPMFVDPSNNDFHLKVGSPAIDAADPTIMNDHDLDGTRRPQGAGPDIGAYEHIP